ncbi:MAG: uroporphyrinogen-III synthase [Myxococcota bacterium]
MPTTWLITREAEDARAERELLEARGATVREVPCVETAWHAWPWPEAVGLTLFTSRRAVSAWERSGCAPLGEVAAVAPSTSGALEALGVEPVVTATGGAVALAEAVVARWRSLGAPPTPVRYPTSSAGLRAPEQGRVVELLSQLGPVDRRVVYDVQAPAALRPALEEATRADWAATFSSPSAVEHFFAAQPLASAPRQVLCVGASTARAWNARRPPSWPDAIVAADLRSTLPEVIP